MSKEIQFSDLVVNGKETEHYTYHIVDESKFFESIKTIENPSISKTTKAYILELTDIDRNRFMVDNLYLLNKKHLNKWSLEELQSVGIKRFDVVTKGGIR
ncbi:hypothetical protein [Leuconostoc gelidum]|uniref:hypothetical protein n=1 Tax=Leuconostoc gelidum TaxID=1244 RepID=UPI001C7DCA74|nr:hypothetical protein [Leuconostoc gelidum]MBZ6009916.1 hypothetical protein [Leuconostoc gelidum subsp. aenigmaticum]